MMPKKETPGEQSLDDVLEEENQDDLLFEHTFFEKPEKQEK
jgi:hypothetical protein